MLPSHLPRRALLLLAVALIASAAISPGAALAQSYGPPRPASRPSGQRQSLVELSAFTGWAVNSDPETNYGRLRIGDAQSFGASLGISSGFGPSLQLSWIYFQPTAQLVGHGVNLNDSTTFDVDTHYFLIGSTSRIRGGIIEPFINGSLGAVVYVPNEFSVAGVNYDPDDTWRMAFALGGGIELFVHPKLALRLGAQLLGTLYFYGASFYTGTNGSALGVTGGIPTVTGNFTIGLTLAP